MQTQVLSMYDSKKTKKLNENTGFEKIWMQNHCKYNILGIVMQTAYVQRSSDFVDFDKPL